MAERKSSPKPAWQKEIAQERILILFKEAEETSKSGRMDLSDRYIELARKIGMRYNVKIPKEMRGKFCRKCFSYLVPDVSCKIENDDKNGLSRVKCFKCNKIIPFKLK